MAILWNSNNDRDSSIGDEPSADDICPHGKLGDCLECDDAYTDLIRTANIKHRVRQSLREAE